MNKIVIATQNKHKIIELKRMLEPLGYDVLTLYDYPQVGDIIEDGATFEENAYIKAKALQEIVQCDVIADDSGLMVDALDGAPGVYSARYAGENADYHANNQKLLLEMEDKNNRKAAFITVVCYLQLHQQPRYFTGLLNGEIAREYKGTNGFGYDPIFVLPDGRHLAEYSMDEKNAISHRAQAVSQLVDYLSSIANHK